MLYPLSYRDTCLVGDVSMQPTVVVNCRLDPKNKEIATTRRSLYARLRNLIRLLDGVP